MNKYWVWFSRINIIGIRTQNELLKIYGTPERIWQLKEEELQNVIAQEKIDIILDKKYRQDLDKYVEYMEKNAIKMFTINDEKYPDKLKSLYDPPVVIYVKGNENILSQKSIAIVGSRNCSDYGKKVAEQFAYNLSKHNINIVSGLATGIDRYAHIGTIIARQKTIAVIGNGINIVYPKENAELYDKIIESEGTIVSEYIVGTTPEKWYFPARNRIISGLSDAILVVEANKTSRKFYNS